MATNPNTGGTDVVVTVPGVARAILPRLAPSDVVRLSNKLVRRLKGRLRANLRNAGVTGHDAMVRLNEFDTRIVTLTDVINRLKEPWLQLEAIRLAIARRDQLDPKTVPDTAVDDLRLPYDMMFLVAARVLNLQLVPVEGATNPPEGGGPQADPASPSPSTSGTPAASAPPST